MSLLTDATDVQLTELVDGMTADLLKQYPNLTVPGMDPFIEFDDDDENETKGMEYLRMYMAIPGIMERDDECLQRDSIAYTCPRAKLSFFVDGDALDRHVAKWRLAIGK